MFRHWKLKVSILQEGPEPLLQCDQRVMHMTVVKIFKHRQSEKCHKSTERRLQRREDSNGEMWRWHRGVGKWISVCRGYMERRGWRMWQRSGIWDEPYTKRMMIGRLCGGTSCTQGRSGGDWGHCSDGKG